ncbi:AraC family transcriptional regulator [Lysobacter sp. CFH 32150]|uniref:AraC family transcriptional regulator n=1 Tax=Lysobacter sp. CFH 32150 TaxID=2927128 RepID=UPI001FA7DAC4|nr:AraC family transcriptional regulator [Lysobacter sp. CFH 32150]MCI4568861.1 AraC family transcriptional regulator [Lysobacter sp. CFH 32150]
MSIADKAVWVIERNSGRPLTLNAIAEACGVSRSHLANAFGAATGLSVMKYLRGRRLSAAARALADGAPDILAVALDAGYGSHEAFTRAFREQFVLTPESVRDRRSLDGIALVEPLELKATAERHLDPPHLVDEGLVRVVGLSELRSFETTIKIPAQWQRFMAYYDAIPAKLDRIPVGVSQPADDEGQFQYMCAVEVSAFGESPKELLQLEIAPRKYAVFEHRGHVSTLYESYSTIWNEALPSRGWTLAEAPTIERHNPTFDTRSGEGGLTLWIPLEG